MKLHNRNGKTLIRLAVIFCLSGFSFGGVYFGRPATADNRLGPGPTATPTRRRSAVTRRSAAAPAPKIYSDFPHSVKAHQMECSNCHKFPSPNWNKVRPESEAFQDITDYPKHDSCVGCHKQQFFKGRPPVVCSICHTNPGPRDSSRHPFPNPREVFDKSPKGQKAPESDFAISFPHDKHVEIVTLDGDPGYKPARGEESCAVCHRTYMPAGDSPDEYITKPPSDLGEAFWLKKGTFKTTPIGHTVCFTCHSLDSGIEPTPVNCNTCHKLRSPGGPADFDPKLAAQMSVADKIMLTQWRHRESAGSFRHEFSMHADMECATCHTVAAMNTLDAKTKKVPISACATCHATATLADGGTLNYEADQRAKNPAFQCVKCHVIFGKRAMPASHTKALEAAK
jgi:hypothetical protein